MAHRVAIPDWQLANSAYADAVVTFHTVDPATGTRAPTLATLYDGLTGAGTLANPHTLDSSGKFAVPVYIEEPVVAVVGESPIGAHATGVIDTGGLWRGPWTTATAYTLGDRVRDGAAGAGTANIHICVRAHTSGTWAADLAAGVWALEINVADVETATVAAETAQGLAEAAQGLAETARDTATDAAATATAQAATATAQAGAASARAIASAASASDADARATDADTRAQAADAHRVAAETAAAAAQGSAGAADTRATNAEQARDRAEQARDQASQIAGMRLFGAIGDGALPRIIADRTADTLHLIGAGPIAVAYDGPARTVTLSAPNLATLDPRTGTVPLDQLPAGAITTTAGLVGFTPYETLSADTVQGALQQIWDRSASGGAFEARQSAAAAAASAAAAGAHETATRDDATEAAAAAAQASAAAAAAAATGAGALAEAVRKLKLHVTFDL
ncbi:hypothetical protein [Roseospira visakhapatnamensis]|uniref:Uncharacterized protein n=1 Tax=Roseospira visakhapatnamensis TaxID=390880 RepID=A0A7W6WAB4_9PROT|nr:hypothetical protein [Roseospira visakhapatnamensis]MBB4266301.1 hypothetical protein [Roseospira visakhapatnamensis]